MKTEFRKVISFCWFTLLFLRTTNSGNSSSISTFLSCRRSWCTQCVLGAAVHRTLSFISVDAHIVIFIAMAIVVDLGVDEPYSRK